MWMQFYVHIPVTNTIRSMLEFSSSSIFSITYMYLFPAHHLQCTTTGILNDCHMTIMKFNIELFVFNFSASISYPRSNMGESRVNIQSVQGHPCKKQEHSCADDICSWGWRKSNPSNSEWLWDSDCDSTLLPSDAQKILHPPRQTVPHCFPRCWPHGWGLHLRNQRDHAILC